MLRKDLTEKDVINEIILDLEEELKKASLSEAIDHVLKWNGHLLSITYGQTVHGILDMGIYIEIKGERIFRMIEIHYKQK